MDGGKEIALLTLWAVFPALMCKPPAMQLEVVRQPQWEINSAAHPPPHLSVKLLQGREKAGLLHWPGDRVVLFPWEVTESPLRSGECVCVCDME